MMKPIAKDTPINGTMTVTTEAKGDRAIAAITSIAIVATNKAMRNRRTDAMRRVSRLHSREPAMKVTAMAVNSRPNSDGASPKARKTKGPDETNTPIAATTSPRLSA